MAFPVFGLANGSLFPLTHSLARSLALVFSFVSFGIPSFPIFVFFKTLSVWFPSLSFFLSAFLTFSSPRSPSCCTLYTLLSLLFFILLICSPPLFSILSIQRVHLWAACSGWISFRRTHRVNVSLDSRRNGVLLSSSPERFDPLQSWWPQQKTTTVRKQKRRLETRS